MKDDRSIIDYQAPAPAAFRPGLFRLSALSFAGAVYFSFFTFVIATKIQRRVWEMWTLYVAIVLSLLGVLFFRLACRRPTGPAGPAIQHQSVTPQNMAIRVVESGTHWPSGRSKPLAELDVDDSWVVRIAGTALASGHEDGLGPWIGIGGKLPSGTCIELLRHDLDGPLYVLHVDSSADPREALAEFLVVTGLNESAVRWRQTGT